MSKTYFVKLKPTGKFFFGGDMRFGVNGKDEKFSSYIIKSSKMPQQTSLLGMMRFLLLSNDAKLFDIEKNRIREGVSVDDLIGKSSFSVNKNKDKKSFGKIVSLGPCSVYKDGKCYFKAPMDNEFSSINWNNIVSATINGKEVKLPELKVKDDNEEKNYTGKHYLKPSFMEISSEDIKAEDDIFEEDSRIGIDKDYEGKSQKNAFYKQISYRLKNGFCFAFDVEVDDEIQLDIFNGYIVNLGADASSFVFEAEEIQPSVKDKIDGLTVVLLSDAYIPQEDVDKCEIRYSITQTRPFRFISTENSSDTSYYRINGKNAAERSERYELYQAGSVFYFEDNEKREKFCEILDGRKDFNQIGYNKYYIKK